MKLVLAGLVLTLGCAGEQKLTPPPPPLRPEAEARESTRKVVAKDCDETAPEDELHRPTAEIASLR